MAKQEKFWFFAWLAFLPVALVRAENLAESDTFWQISTGLFTIAHGQIPTVDPFSWTANGEPWPLDSRNDLYGAERVQQSLLVLDGQGDIADGLAGAGCVLVSPTSGLAHHLQTSPDWELTSTETTAQLFVRR